MCFTKVLSVIAFGFGGFSCLSRKGAWNYDHRIWWWKSCGHCPLNHQYCKHVQNTNLHTNWAYIFRFLPTLPRLCRKKMEAFVHGPQTMRSWFVLTWPKSTRPWNFIRQSMPYFLVRVSFFISKAPMKNIGLSIDCVWFSVSHASPGILSGHHGGLQISILLLLVRLFIAKWFRSISNVCCMHSQHVQFCLQSNNDLNVRHSKNMSKHM